MAPTSVPKSIREPFPISQISGRYLLFDVDVITHCRRAHNICGLLIGTIPNLSQQNVFLGIPLELMPEEARVLVDNGAAYIADDVKTHSTGFMDMSREARLKYLEEIDREGQEVAQAHAVKAERRKDRALKDKGLKKEDLEGKKDGSAAENATVDEPSRAGHPHDTSFDLGFIMKGSTFLEPTLKSVGDTSTEPESLFPSSSSAPTPMNPTKSSGVQKHFVTPTTSYPPLQTPSPDKSTPLPSVPNSYPLFRYLHSKGYFHMPGLRFGCHYNVYPGDPLRYHSHFAATGMSWDAEFDLLDIVGGGRLGTGTKKAYLIGGEDSDPKDSDDTESVRAFSIEWAAL